MRCGIEFEYLLTGSSADGTEQLLDDTTLDFRALSALLADKPGLDDPLLAQGDLGIKRGYWYLEGDERFEVDGRFRTLAVKGVEIRTPIAADPRAAIRSLLALEGQLAQRLAQAGLGLAIAAFHPYRSAYIHDPPLNAWEQALRRQHRAYDGSHVATLSFGPDINLSDPTWSIERSLDVARLLNAHAAPLVAFSCNSPFAEGRPWPGCSRRLDARAAVRPVVRLFVDATRLTAAQRGTVLPNPLVCPARGSGEHGRIEFKAFDAVASADLLLALAQLLVGLGLDTELPGRSEHVDVAAIRRAARRGLRDPVIHAQAAALLERAAAALRASGRAGAVADLAPLRDQIERRQMPADATRVRGAVEGRPYFNGGLGRACAPTGSTRLAADIRRFEPIRATRSPAAS